jgi:hypothetical protein
LAHREAVLFFETKGAGVAQQLLDGRSPETVGFCRLWKVRIYGKTKAIGPVTAGLPDPDHFA